MKSEIRREGEERSDYERIQLDVEKKKQRKKRHGRKRGEQGVGWGERKENDVIKKKEGSEFQMSQTSEESK